MRRMRMKAARSRGLVSRSASIVLPGICLTEATSFMIKSDMNSPARRMCLAFLNDAMSETMCTADYESHSNCTGWPSMKPMSAIN